MGREIEVNRGRAATAYFEESEFELMEAATRQIDAILVPSVRARIAKFKCEERP